MSTILYSEQREDGCVHLLCEGCFQPTDWVTPYEAAHMAIQGYRIFCFECDSYEADRVPRQLHGLETEYLLNGRLAKDDVRKYLSPLASIPYSRVSPKNTEVQNSRSLFERMSQVFKDAFVIRNGVSNEK